MAYLDEGTKCTLNDAKDEDDGTEDENPCSSCLCIAQEENKKENGE